MKDSIVIVLFLALFSFSCSNQDAFFEKATCYTNVNIIDPEQGLRENMTLVIQDDRILKVSPSDEIQLSDKNQIFDGSGKFMIPGLWDAHVHFSYIRELAPSMFNLFLAYGVTSVRDTGGDINFVSLWKARAKSNPTDAPRVMVAGPLLDGMPNVYDGSAPSRPKLSVGIRSTQDAIITADMIAESNVDFLKAYEMLSPEEFQAICNVGKAAELKVTGHVPLSMDVISASNAGLNSMEHLRNLELSCATNSDELLQQRRRLLKEGSSDLGGVLRSRIHSAQRINAIQNQDPTKTKKVLEVLEKNQTWQIPTLALNSGMVKRPFFSEEWISTFDYLPDSIATTWINNIATLKETSIAENRTLFSDWAFNMTKQVHDAGIGIMAGTDCPIFFLTPGRSLHQELAMLVEAGLTPLAALNTATVLPAEYFNLQHELGLVKEGYLADLVLLDANPLEDINNTLKINAIIKAGKYHLQTDLLEKLN